MLDQPLPDLGALADDDLDDHSKVHATVTIAYDQPQLRVRIADDGCGFTGPGREGGLGLTGMRERARLAGGWLDVRSVPGQGTTVELRL